MDVSKKNAALVLGACVALGAAWVGVRAQSTGNQPTQAGSTIVLDPSKTVIGAKGKTGWKMPPRPAPECCGYPFPRETDAEIADGAVHIVHYEDSHIMLMEVAKSQIYFQAISRTGETVDSGVIANAKKMPLPKEFLDQFLAL